MKLFKVHFEVDLMVLAESQELAEEAVVSEEFDWNDEIQNGCASAQEVVNIADVPEPDSLPWMVDEGILEITCAEFLAQKNNSK